MFDFNARRDDAAGLMDLLEEFMVSWYQLDPPEPTTYRSALNAVPMPDPLRRVYEIAEWWGVRPWADAFASSHEILFPFNVLRVEGDRLIFTSEIHGLWMGATSLSGCDAPVWVQVEADGWELLSPSLAQYLVNHCLRDVTRRASYVVDSGDLIRRLQAAERQVHCIWNGYSNCLPDHIYVGPQSFHLVDGHLLVTNNHCWMDTCATDSYEAKSWLQDFFHDDGWSQEFDDGPFNRAEVTQVRRDVYRREPHYTEWSGEDPFGAEYDEKSEFWINRRALEIELHRAQNDAEESPKRAAWAAARAAYLEKKLKELYPADPSSPG